MKPDGRSALKTFTDGLWVNSPIAVAGLGLCSALAVTGRAKYALTMCAGVTFVTVFTSVAVSVIRLKIHPRVRMAVYTLITASLVICFDRFLKAFFPLISNELGPYVGLIVTNCIIFGRAEVFASKNPPGLSAIDALGHCAGYSMALIFVSSVRELFSAGSIFGINFFPLNFKPVVVMEMSPGAFLALAVYIWVVRSIKKTAGGNLL